MIERNQRMSEEFLKECDEIILKRLKTGMDKKPQSYSRIALAMTRTGEIWDEMKEMIISANFKEDKRGQADGLIGIIVFVVLAFVIVMFLGVWGYVSQILTDTLTTIPSSGSVNITDAAVNTFGAINNALVPGLKILSFVLIFGMVLMIFLTNFLVKKHPLYFFIHVIMTMFAVILSVPISNSYEGFLTGQVFSSQLQGFTAATFIMRSLPVWVAVIGLIGAMILVINIRRNEEAIL